MGNRYKKLGSGAKVTDFSRTVYNDTIDMLRWWRSFANKTGGGRGAKLKLDFTWHECYNDTGEDLDAFSVVGLDGPLFTPSENLAEFLNKSPLEGVAPDEDDHAGKVGVFLEPVKADGIGRVCVAGVLPVLLEVEDEDDERAGIDDGECTHLRTGSTGYRIIWMDSEENEDDDGRRWGLILLPCWEEGDDDSSDSSDESSDESSDPSDESSDESGSDSGPSGSDDSDSDSGSSKDHAIVKASWTEGGCAAMTCVEATGVMFEDTVVAVDVPMVDCDILIDPHFLELCEPGTVECHGKPSSEEPCTTGERVFGNVVRMKFAEQKPDVVTRLVIPLQGVRKGFRGWRMPSKTHEDRRINEWRLNLRPGREAPDEQ